MPVDYRVGIFDWVTKQNEMNAPTVGKRRAATAQITIS
jgi:hypothetical protein